MIKQGSKRKLELRERDFHVLGPSLNLREISDEPAFVIFTFDNETVVSGEIVAVITSYPISKL